MKTITLWGITICFLLFCYPQQLLGQPPSFDNDTSDVPLDGGLSILLALGIGYGIKKNLKQGGPTKKNKPAPNE
jgi:hypothetical protein